MKIIRCISEKIREEIKDAEAYIDLATEWKDEKPEVAEMFYDLSTEEMGHAEKLHEAVKDLIKEYREENGEPPERMLALYEFTHEEQMKDSMRVKVKQAMYKG